MKRPFENERYEAGSLISFSNDLLKNAGLSLEIAAVVSDILLTGDLYGHTTHGLQLLVPYLKCLDSGTMTTNKEPITVRDQGSTLVWNGQYLPGPWLVSEAIKLAELRVKKYGAVTIVIRQSHHIACLQAYLKKVTDHNHVILLMCSDPATASVAPFGGVSPTYTPNPIAVGIPTDQDPILIDFSASTTTNGACMRLHKKGEKLPQAWLKDSQGNTTKDPGVLFEDPAGSILPLGGVDLGHKGFSLGIMVEALTSALGGYGRKDEPTRWGASVFIQIIDPSSFGGVDAFLKETTWLANACRSSNVPEEGSSVRLPGEAALRRMRDQLTNGVKLYPGILSALETWAKRFQVQMPTPVQP